MKTQPLLGIVILSLLLVGTGVPRAAARGADWPSGSLTHADDIGFIAVGVDFEEQKRDLHDDTHSNAILRSRAVYGMLNLDLLNWFTIMGGAGQIEVKPHKYHDYEDPGLIWTAGARAVLWDHNVAHPPFLANRLRLDGAVSYWESESEYFGYDMEWEELRAALVFSAEMFVQERGQRTDVYPYSVVFSVGAVYSEIEGEAETGLSGFAEHLGTPVEFEGAEDVGGLLGVDIYISHNWSLSGEARLFQNTTLTVGSAFHF